MSEKSIKKKRKLMQMLNSKNILAQYHIIAYVENGKIQCQINGPIEDRLLFDDIINNIQRAFINRELKMRTGQQPSSSRIVLPSFIPPKDIGNG